MLVYRDRTVIACSAGNRHPRRRWIALLALLALMLAPPAWSQATCFWNQNGPGQWDNPANWNGCSGGNGSPAGTPGPADHAHVGNIAPLADVDVGASARTVDRLTLSAGRIFGDGDISVTTRLDWTGGTIDGGGAATQLLLESASVSEIAGNNVHILANRDLRIFGEVTWAGGDIEMHQDAEIDIQGQLIIDYSLGGGRGGAFPLELRTDFSPGARIHNSATPGARIEKLGNALVRFVGNVTFDNGNDVLVNDGTLQINGPGGDFGAYQIAPLARLEFGTEIGVTRTLTGSSAIAGSGTLHKFEEGTLEIIGGYALTGQTEVVDGTLFIDAAADPLSLPRLRVRSPGIFSSPDNLEITNLLDWNGGEINGTSAGLALTLAASATATIALDDVHDEALLRSRNLLNQGSVLLSGTGTSPFNHKFTLDSADIDNQGVFEMRSNNQNNLVLDCIAYDCGSFFNRAGATLRLNDIQGIVVVGPGLTALNNAGTVELIDGCGGINPPGVDTGTYSFDSFCTLAFFTRPDTERVFEESVILNSVNGSGLQVAGSLRLNGSARDFGYLIIDSDATLFGPAAITFTSTTEWRGGIEGSTSETVTVAPGATLRTNSEPSDTPLLFGRTLINNGGLDVRVRVQLGGNAEIINNGQLNLFGTPVFAGAFGCESPPPLCGLITNAASGSIQSVAAVSGPATQLEPGISVDSVGSLLVDSGVLAFEADLTAGSGSIVDIQSGAGLRRTVNNLVLAEGILRGAGVIHANLDVDAVNIEPADVDPGNLTILGNFTATSDTRYTMGIAGTDPPLESVLGVRAPTGTPTYDRLTIAGTASLDGTLDVVNLGYTASGSDVFDLMRYASRTGNVVSGANPYSGVGLNPHTEATRIRLAGAAGGGCEWNPGGGGPNNWTNPLKWTNCSGGVGPGPGPAGTPGASDTAIVGGSSLVNLDVPVTVAELQFTGGTILGSNNLTISSNLIWTGGTIQGESGSMVTLGSGALGTLAGGQHNLDGRIFLLQGTANWTTGLIRLVNGGVLDVESGGILNTNPSLAFESIFGTGGIPEVRNDGVINKLGPNFSGIGQSVRYSGSGSINVSAGDFTFAATSIAALTGSYTAAAGASLQFVGGSRTFGPSATLDGGSLVFGDSGPVAVNTVQNCIGSASTVIIRNAELVLNCAGPSNLAVLLMTEPLAVLEGSSAIQVTGNFGWGHGTIRGTGLGQTFEIASGATAQFDAPQGPSVSRILSNRRLRNDGTISWIAPNTTEVNDGAQFVNEAGGQFFLAGSGARNVSSNTPATALLTNNGAMNLDDGVLADLDVRFDNAGSVQLLNGALRVRRNGNDLGSYAIGAGNLLYFDGAVRTMGPGAVVSGAGGVRVVGSAAVTTNGTFQPHDLRIESGGVLQIDSAAPQTIQSLFLQDGTLTGNAEVRVGTYFDWRHGGELASVGASPGALVVQSGALLEMCSGLCVLNNRELRIEGLADWNGGVIEVPTGASGKIVVATGGTLQTTTYKSAARFRCAAPTCTAEMEVAGSLQQLGDGAELQLSSPMLVNGGTLRVGGSYLEVPGVTLSSGAIELFGHLTANPVVLNGGVLRGNGLIDGAVDNLAGRVQPGASPGQITILGSYTQDPAGILDIEVGGLAPGVNSDFVFASATCSIDGTLNVTNAGFPLSAPATLDVLSCSSGLSGNFAATNSAYPGYQVSYSATHATLVPGGGPLVVNTVGDAGDGICDVSECTLRDALIGANLMPDPDVIAFDIPAPQCSGPGGACVIAPLALLPQITSPILIDGYSQSGAVANTQAPSLGLGSNAILKIELDGSLVPEFCGDGLVISAPGQIVEIRGLSIHHFCGGIVTFGSGDANYRIAGNFIGPRADGSVAPQGNLVGVSIQGGSVFVGDPVDPAAGTNVISGNLNQGISIQSLPALAGLAVRGNLIGTSADGLSARPNGQQGILISTSSAIANVVIGGNQPDHRNVISGNAQDGIRFDCTAVSGNCFDGSRVLGNFIGPAADGNPLGNLGNGVNLSAMDGGRVRVGDINPGEGNRIAFNGGNGIRATFGGVGRASFLRNDIYLNGQLGIDLGGDGRTTNDSGDSDAGANGLLNFPTFTAYTAPGGNSAIIDVLLDTPDIGGNYPARVDFYKAVEDEPGVWLGTTTCASPGVSCPASFAFPGGVTVASDDVVLGIVTDGFGKSSEASFYAATTTVSAPDATIGTSYAAVVEVAVVEPFTALGTVDVDDGTGESCVVTLSEVSPGLSGGSCLLDAVAPAGARTLTASYTPETSPARPFSNSSDTDTVLISAALLPPVVTQISPASGPVAGGTLVTIIGANFVVGSTSVSFGAIPAGAVNCTSSTQCTATAPAGINSVSVRATTVDGTSVDTPADDYTYTSGTLCTNVAPSAFYGAGSQPRDLAVGDFDGDGDIDIATVNSIGSASVSVLLGDGTGAFASPVPYGVPAFPRAIAIGDFNGDGNSDLVTANYGSTTVSILLGNGNGSFGTAAQYSAGSGPHGVAVGDFNADGRVDVAVALLDLDSVAIMLGNGDGSLGAPAVISGLRSVSIGVGDFNRNGRSDFAIGNRITNAASVALGAGDGSFGAPAAFPVGTNPSDLAIADFNGDGISDLAVSNRTSDNVSVLIGDGSGNFAAATNFGVATQPTAVDADDFNGDGHADLAVAHAGSTVVALLLGTGTGSFAAPTYFTVGAGGSGVAFADVDGDGRVDLVAANEFSNDVSILLNLGCAPSISSIDPASGPESGGTLVTLTGSDFAIGATTVNFGATPATGVSCTDTVCTATSPAGSGSVSVSATTVAGTSSSPATFTYIPAALPIVNTNVDPGDGTCDLAECTLREAIALANLTMAPDVTFDPAFFSIPRTITLTAGELVPTQDVNIIGPSATLVVSGNNASRILFGSSINLSLSNLSLTGGNSTGLVSPGVGGAILLTAGSLTLTDVVLGSNSCTAAGTGGAIASTFGTLNLLRTSVTGNTCDDVGGIYVQDGNLSIIDSSLTGNGGTDGEALRVTANSVDAVATLSNVTISDNSTTSSSSAIRSEPLVAGRTVAITLTNVTVSGNTTSSAGGNGAIWQRPAGGNHVTLLQNTIVAGNLVGGLANDIEGVLDVDSAFNVIGSGGGLSNGINGNQTGVADPLLASLANYGGQQLTRALLPGSPAINAGNNGLATNTDQRGIARPQQGTVDVGAFESQGFVLSTVSGTPQSTFANTAFPMPLVVGVAPNSAGEPVEGGQVLYSAPGAGASATFTNPAIISAGEASMLATANSIAGSYVVSASATGATGAPTFALTNGCPSTLVTSGNDSGPGSLRQIIVDACPGSTVTFAGAVAAVGLSTEELLIDKDLTIDGGAGVSVARLPASPDFRIFRIDAGATVVLDSLTISNGNVGDDGGGIHNSGNLTLLDSVVSGNASAAGNGGGGIANSGTLVVDNTTISLNSASFAGGGLLQVNGGSAELTRCTLSGNSAPQGGAATSQSVSADASLSISNCTISGNSATAAASSLLNVSSGAGTSATMTLRNSTIASNTGAAGAIVTAVNEGAATTTLRNNIYAGNLGDNVVDFAPGATTSLGNNLSDDVTGVGGPGDLINTDPLLAPLGNYGGTTQTHALLPGSPAIDAGSSSGSPPTDQRGIVRPQLSAPDIGAFESRGFVLSLVSGTPQSAPVNAAFALPLVVGVSANAVGEPVNGGQITYLAPVSGASATFSSPATIAAAQASLAASANGIVGSYSVTAGAAGATGTPTFALSNGSLATTTTIAGIAPATSVVGQPYVVTVSVVSGVEPVVSGQVEVRQLSDGSVCSIDLATASSCQLVGTSALTTAVRATYQGASGYAPSQSASLSHVVNRADTAIQIVADTPDPSVAGVPITITVELPVVAPGAGEPSGTILVTDGIASCGITLPNLSCELIPKAVGVATLEARYLGDANFNTSIDTEPHTFTADGADLAIIKRNGLRLIPGGAPSTYVLLVSNAGPQAVVNARVTDILPAQFSNASWTCSASSGASCPASGPGTVDTLVSLAAGSSVTFALTATAQVTPEQVVTNRATVSPPANAPDPVLGNNESIDIDPIGIFGEGFETEDE